MPPINQLATRKCVVCKVLALFSFIHLMTNESKRERIHEKITHFGNTTGYGIARVVCAEGELPCLRKCSETGISAAGSGLTMTIAKKPPTPAQELAAFALLLFKYKP